MSDSTSDGPRGVDARLPHTELEANYAAEFRRARDEGVGPADFKKDASLWSSDPEVQVRTGYRLGWLDAPADFTERIASLDAYVRSNPLTHVDPKGLCAEDLCIGEGTGAYWLVFGGGGIAIWNTPLLNAKFEKSNRTMG